MLRFLASPPISLALSAALMGGYGFMITLFGAPLL